MVNTFFTLDSVLFPFYRGVSPALPQYRKPPRFLASCYCAPRTYVKHRSKTKETKRPKAFFPSAGGSNEFMQTQGGVLPHPPVMPDRGEPAKSSPAQSPAPAVALLSCELCSKRKIRCDKRQPCSACVASGKECIPVIRPRLPRGRKGGRRDGNSELRTRVRRLEDLLRSLEPVDLNERISKVASSTSPSAAAGLGECPSRGSFAGAMANSPLGVSPRSLSSEVTAQEAPGDALNLQGMDISRGMGSTLWTQLGSEVSIFPTNH